jgi:hypothetical protein
MSANTLNNQLYLAEAVAADPGAGGTIVVEKSLAVCNLVSAAAEARTLGRPLRQGVIISIHMKTDGGDITLTVTGGYDESGDTTYVFSDPGQFITLQSFYDGTNYYWRKIADHASGNVSLPVAGVAAGYKVARGEIALDGSNPTPVATGLTTIVSAQATIKRTSAVTSGTAFVTVDFTGSDGTLNLYAWVLAGTASSGTETIEWVAVGT